METQGTRVRLVAAAAELLEAQGYHATGVTQILERSSAPKGSLYHHFPGGKAELAAEAVAASGSAVTAELDALVESGADFLGAVDVLTSRFGQRLQRSGFQTGCPLATVALETAATIDPVGSACRSSYRAWQERIEQLMLASGLPLDQASAMALLAFSAIEGALILCQTERSVEPLEEAARQLKVLVRNCKEGGSS